MPTDLQRDAASILLWSPYELSRQPVAIRRKVERAAAALHAAVTDLGPPPHPACIVEHCPGRAKPLSGLCIRHYKNAWRLRLETDRYLDWLALRKSDPTHRRPPEWLHDEGRDDEWDDME